jgi:DEAD/DEAH box helicase domain-containing protein
MIEETIDRIRASAFFKGQIYKIGQKFSGRENAHRVDPQPNKESPIFSYLIPDILKTFSFEGLYEHQSRLLHQIRKVQNSIICTASGSGKSFVSFLAAIETVLVNYRNVLFVVPNQNLGTIWVKKFQFLIKDADWFYGIEYEKLLTKRDVEAFRLGIGIPQILFITPEIINQELIQKKEKWDPYLNDLHLIIIDNAEFYTGVYGIHCTHLFRRFKRILHLINCDPVYSVSMIPLRGYDEFVKTLLNVEFRPEHVISNDAKNWVDKHFVFWNPPLDISHEDPKKIVRSKASKELYALIRIMEELYSPDDQIVVLIKNLEVSEWDLKNLFVGITEPELQIGKQIFCTQDISELSAEVFDYQKVKSIAIMGYPGTLPILVSEILHLGLEPMIIFIINAQDPLSQFYMRNSEEFFVEGSFRIERIYLDLSNRTIMETHLLASIFDHAIDEEGIVETFGTDGLELINKKMRAKNEKGVLHWDRVKSRIRKVNGIKILKEFYVKDFEPSEYPQFSIFSPSPLYCPIVQEDGVGIGILSPTQALQKGFSGSIIHNQKNRYRIKKLIYENNSPKISHLVVEREQEFIRTEKISEVSIQAKELKKRIVEKLRLEQYFGRIEISESILGYRQFYRFECESEREVRLEKHIEVNFETDACIFHFKVANGKSYPIHHSIKHLLKILLPTIIRYQKDEIEFRLVNLENFGGLSIVVYDNDTDGIGYARFLFENLLEIETILDRSYNLLTDCPCPNGCSSCLKIMDCRDSDYNGQIDKRRTIEFLGEILEKKDLPTQIHKKYEALGDKEGDFEILKDIAQIVLRVLKDKLGIEIQNPVSTSFMDKKMSEKYKRIAGFWDLEHNIIAMQPGHSELYYFDVLTHEYFHDWQSKSGKFNNEVLTYYSTHYIDDLANIPFRGKLIVEGSANWAEFKAIDYFNLSGEMLRLNHQHFDQYGEGFHFIRFLESLYGMKGVFDFFESLILKDRNGQIKAFDDFRSQLYTESGVEANIHQKAKHEIDRGGLICLGYLDRRFDIICISHYFDCTKDDPTDFPPKTKDLSREALSATLRRASIADILKANSSAKEIFIKNGMQCPSCASSEYETVENAAYMHSRRPKDTDPGVSGIEMCNKVVDALTDLFLQEFEK